jgi:transcriptional regulator with XRE-family HTH domain
MSQAALARRLDISTQAVNQWAVGKTTPTRDRIVRLEDELAVQPRGSLLLLAGYSPNGSEDRPTIESLIRADETLSPEDKRVLLRMLAVLRRSHQPQ